MNLSAWPGIHLRPTLASPAGVARQRIARNDERYSLEGMRPAPVLLRSENRCGCQAGQAARPRRSVQHSDGAVRCISRGKSWWSLSAHTFKLMIGCPYCWRTCGESLAVCSCL